MTANERLLELYKFQYEWAVTHRNSIYQRAAILMAFLGVVLGLLGIMLLSDNKPNFITPWTEALGVGTVLMLPGGTFIIFVLRSSRIGIGRVLEIDSWLEQNPAPKDADLVQELVPKFERLAKENIWATRMTRETYNLGLASVFSGTILIGVSLGFMIGG